jgi:hypothetical protein
MLSTSYGPSTFSSYLEDLNLGSGHVLKSLGWETQGLGPEFTGATALASRDDKVVFSSSAQMGDQYVKAKVFSKESGFNLDTIEFLYPPEDYDFVAAILEALRALDCYVPHALKYPEEHKTFFSETQHTILPRRMDPVHQPDP